MAADIQKSSSQHECDSEQRCLVHRWLRHLHYQYQWSSNMTPMMYITTSTQTNERTSEQTNKQAPANKQTNKRTKERASEQASKQATKQTIKE